MQTITIVQLLPSYAQQLQQPNLIVYGNDGLPINYEFLAN